MTPPHARVVPLPDRRQHARRIGDQLLAQVLYDLADEMEEEATEERVYAIPAATVLDWARRLRAQAVLARFNEQGQA